MQGTVQLKHAAQVHAYSVMQAATQLVHNAGSNGQWELLWQASMAANKMHPKLGIKICTNATGVKITHTKIIDINHLIIIIQSDHSKVRRKSCNTPTIIDLM